MPTSDVEIFSLPSLSRDLLDEPLAYFAAEHERHRAVYAFLKRASHHGMIGISSALSISGFLRDELRLHFEDERLSLHPALRSRSVSDSDFIQSIQRIEQLHANSEVLAKRIGGELENMSAKNMVRMSQEFSELLADYARKEHENLVFESAVIMAIAEVRLKKADIAKIRTSMKLRRGVPV